MATETTNYKFIKDAPNEYYDVAKVNANLDKIDEAIEGALDKANQAFQSASDGKQVIATAITGKGVPTSSSDTFQKMATNIDAIETDPSIGTTNAVAGDILSPKKVISQGKLLTGTIPSKGAATITPTTSPQTIAANQYLSGAQTIAGVSVPVANVLAGVTIAGAVGTMPNRGALNQTISSNNGQVNMAAGYYTGGVIKAIFANLIASNIKAGVNIGGVVGNLNSVSGPKLYPTYMEHLKPGVIQSIDWVEGSTFLILAGASVGLGTTMFSHLVFRNGSTQSIHADPNGRLEIVSNTNTKLSIRIKSGFDDSSVSLAFYG